MEHFMFAIYRDALIRATIAFVMDDANGTPSPASGVCVGKPNVCECESEC